MDSDKTMSPYRLRRENDIDLVFTGRELAKVSSRDEKSGNPRWTEIRIFRTISGKYVVEQVGKTTFTHEVERVTVKIADSASEVATALRRKDEVEYLTYLALDALEMAASADEDLAQAIVERI